MATLGRIRNRSGLLLAVIGIAMLSFILGDFLKSTNSGGGQGLYVGNVLGEDVFISSTTFLLTAPYFLMFFSLIFKLFILISLL